MYETNGIKFLAAAVRAFNSTTGERLEVYGERHHEIFHKLRAAGVPRLDIMGSEQGFLVSVDNGLPCFYDRKEATEIAKKIGISIIGTELTSEDLW